MVEFKRFLQYDNFGKDITINRDEQVLIIYLIDKDVKPIIRASYEIYVGNTYFLTGIKW